MDLRALPGGTVKQEGPFPLMSRNIPSWSPTFASNYPPIGQQNGSSPPCSMTGLNLSLAI